MLTLALLPLHDMNVEIFHYHVQNGLPLDLNESVCSLFISSHFIASFFFILCLYIYIYIYVCVCIFIYMYVYIGTPNAPPPSRLKKE